MRTFRRVDNKPTPATTCPTVPPNGSPVPFSTARSSSSRVRSRRPARRSVGGAGLDGASHASYPTINLVAPSSPPIFVAPSSPRAPHGTSGGSAEPQKPAAPTHSGPRERRLRAQQTSNRAASAQRATLGALYYWHDATLRLSTALLTYSPYVRGGSPRNVARRLRTASTLARKGRHLRAPHGPIEVS